MSCVVDRARHRAVRRAVRLQPRRTGEAIASTVRGALVQEVVVRTRCESFVASMEITMGRSSVGDALVCESIWNSSDP